MSRMMSNLPALWSGACPGIGQEHALLLWPDVEPQEEELRHTALVISPHAAFPSLGNEKWEMPGT